ncbi:DUF2974 domain-containing protein [Cetobacterium sp. 2A]|uniref:Mbeg1-like protein n=1 Tax=Cetobacterium sp. 2A TaxID=2754723 RepID=UPI00163D2EA7|nr:Mbeg1-like protein [Cetobacterium sp. 2A]MBC2856981.1 DUF2974 domain-containing protein [Cetobacterium sp. 2A]
MYHEEDKRLFGVYGIEKNKDNSKLMNPLYNFDGWQFIYSADGKKIQKDYLDVNSLKETGFFATAFMKDDNIIIAYRGTDEGIDHLGVNLSIGINKVHNQLIEAVCFYEYVKIEFGKNKTISFTGHSLGGALAQSAYLYSGKNNTTVTWNALGFGDFENKFKLDNQSFSSFLSKIYELRLPEFSPESMIQVDTNKILLEKWKNYKIEDVTEGKVYESIYSTLSKPDSTQNYRELLKKDTAMLTMLLRLSHNYSQNKVIINNDIKNYYIKYDLVPKIKTRIGKTVIIPLQKEENDKKKIPELTAYHSVNLFLLYMSHDGNIDNTRMNSVFLDNAVKTNYLNLRSKDRLQNILKSGTKNITEKDSIKNDLKKYCLRLDITTKSSNIENLLDLFGEDVKKDLSDGFFCKCEYKEYSKDEKAHRGNFDGCFTLGQLNNTSIGGIIGGQPETIEKESKPQPKEEEPVAKTKPKGEDKYRIKEGNATVTEYNLCSNVRR